MKAPKQNLDNNNRKSRDRKSAERHGRLAETFAAIALRLKGYKILARNYKTKSGEIDIIARRGDLVAIVEVKARRELMQSAEAVSWTSRQRIKNAADHWLASRRDGAALSLRFDIIAVQPLKWPRHLEDAF